jgi:hypothetical protein
LNLLAVYAIFGLDLVPPRRAIALREVAAMNVQALVEPDRVHKSVYTDQQIFDAEITNIFEKIWVYCGHESQVPNPGDYYAVSSGRQPMLMVRGADGSVNVLHNRCPHRGVQRLVLQLGVARIARHRREREGDLAARHQRHERLVQAVLDEDAYLRLRAAQAGQRQRQQARRLGRAAADAQALRRRLLQLGQAHRRLPELGLDAPRMADQDVGVRRRDDAVAVALEQGHAEVVLERLDAHAERRLRDAEAFGRAGQAAGADGREQVPDALGIEGARHQPALFESSGSLCNLRPDRAAQGRRA